MPSYHGYRRKQSAHWQELGALILLFVLFGTLTYGFLIAAEEHRLPKIKLQPTPIPQNSDYNPALDPLNPVSPISPMNPANQGLVW